MTAPVVARAVIRALIRQSRAWAEDAQATASRGISAAAAADAPPLLADAPPLLAVRAPLSTEAWRVGAHGAALAGTAYHAAALKAELPQVIPLVPADERSGTWKDGASLRAWILQAARHPAATVDAGLAGLRALQSQRAMERCSSTATSAGVRVDATSALVTKKTGVGGDGGLVLDWGGGGGPSTPLLLEEDSTRWLFTYRLRITHVGGGGEAGEAGGVSSPAPTTTSSHHPAVQLLTRSWTIREKSGRLHATVPPGSPGLVGATPTLAVGQCFEYYSATDLKVESGVMKGAFGARWVGEDSGGGGGGSGGGGSGSGARFEVAVAPFALHADPLRVGSGM